MKYLHACLANIVLVYTSHTCILYSPKDSSNLPRPYGPEKEFFAYQLKPAVVLYVKGNFIRMVFQVPM